MKLPAVVVGSLVLSVLIGCAAEVTPTAEASPPEPPGEVIPLRTAGPPAEGMACMMALMDNGRLVADPRSGLGVAVGGGVTPVVWPWGYSAILADGVIGLFDHQGQLVASAGDRISMGGGFGGDGFWYTCHGQVNVIGGN